MTFIFVGDKVIFLKGGKVNNQVSKKLSRILFIAIAKLILMSHDFITESVNLTKAFYSLCTWEILVHKGHFNVRHK